ncbi:DJ-1 family glyoxalase III [Streptococcus sp. DD13]|uniref:DJ-1 family glyoxalase III n=1 Tax=Streptococcus sp. DD13 TaxID=1777881 RepID=UPI00079B18C3|nr:DJ-1 family glyoxalase III [Streptococcus sp. DD13]KXT79094.1 ThiJ/PfpI family protein [Streptococcus sp. DD13]
MTTVAVLFAEGFEEIEALTPVDVFRRAGFTCEMIGLTSIEVTGSHGITVQTDKVFDGELASYDLVLCPGGMPGSANLRDHTSLIEAIQQRDRNHQWLAAICAAPIVLAKAGVLENRKFTCFPGVEAQIQDGIHQTETVVVDGHVVTSRGAGTALAFSYQLVDLLGGDGQALAQQMVYQQLFEEVSSL